MPKILEKCIEEGMPVLIYNWLSVKDVYFSLVVKRFPWLNDFHKCAPENTSQRSQIAEDILISDNKSVFLFYLEKKRVLVDFRDIGEIVYDFSVEWLKMFIKENHNRIKQIEKDDYKETIITYLHNKNDKDIVIIVNRSKHSILQKVLDDLSLNSSYDIAVTIKKPKTVCPDEEYLIKIYENRSLLKDFNKSFKQRAIHSFRRPGVLNKYILSYIHDLEGCAMVIASVFRESYHVKNFLRKITFVIENESLLISFMNHFLRFVKSKVPLFLIRKWADSIDPIVLAGKVNVFDLGTLIDNYYSEDLKKGILIRGYSYVNSEEILQ
ncbi:hypothetical protein NBO_11g0069 [Nosema bombycis CQ1]|uniref:Uncharacterized protein n=1 Tax=Nosema bombycis (strain CQ1 / CVCC 102059) TaxID=578461 RepID=R0MQ55_NOSB1|nr:hypothetical protein NBO_11g0069 [Nosema bombycis CQ1]|eukprot:EOB14998.1 hypothetical protein NBO_11g0069 [Nosema bombycis CQ1]